MGHDAGKDHRKCEPDEDAEQSGVHQWLGGDQHLHHGDPDSGERNKVNQGKPP